MHIAHELKRSMIDVEVAGRAGALEDVLDWEIRDRLGVVATSPLGALGAGLLTLLCATAFYDAENLGRRRSPLYPPIYLFHVGRSWGFHGEFDFWPDRKEIVVTDKTELLASINTHAITHLAVPDREPSPLRHRYKEPEEALDRLKQAFVYSPLGNVDRPDVTLRSTEAKVLSNFDFTVNLANTVILREQEVADSPRYRPGRAEGDDAHRYVNLMREHLAEVDEFDSAFVAARERIMRALRENSLSESLRRVDTERVLSMLG